MKINDLDIDIQPLFSVLIANYNNAPFLIESIESALNQSYKNFEIIIVDDCSTDNSKEIYDLYKSNSKIKIFYNEINKGCGYTKNKCVELSKGKFFGFLDPDDTLTSNAIEEMVLFHQINPTSSLVFSNLFVCNKNLKVLYEFKKANMPFGVSLLDQNAVHIHHFATAKRELYKKTEKIDVTLKRAVDFDFYIKMEEVGKITHVNKTLYYYRIHTNGISSEKNSIKANVWGFLVIINACKRRGIDFEPILVNKLLKNSVRNTIEFKIGFVVFFPLRFIKRLFKNALKFVVFPFR